MSQDEHRQDAGTRQDAVEPTVVEAGHPPTEDESTVGTGTSIALGCIAATLLLIVFALVMLGIMALV